MNTTDFGYQKIATSEKNERVRAIFDSVAPRYDLMNDLMSFGIHRLWKRLAVSKCAPQPNQTILDLAAGTGDLSNLLVKSLGANCGGKVVLTDINEAMLAIAKKKLLDNGIVKPVEFIQASAEDLPFPTASFNTVVIAFGLRNVTDKPKALVEMLRVLKPLGRVVILEFSKPESKQAALNNFNKLYDAYSFTLLPLLGKMICNDSQSYRYLAESIRVHPDQATLKTMMETAGFRQVSFQNLQGGIVALHWGFKL